MSGRSIAMGRHRPAINAVTFTAVNLLVCAVGLVCVVRLARVQVKLHNLESIYDKQSELEGLRIQELTEKKQLKANVEQKNELSRQTLHELEEAYADELRNCRFELETLEAEWSGKIALAIEESTLNKEDRIEELTRRAQEDKEQSVKAKLKPLQMVESDLIEELDDLVERLVKVEHERILGRWFEKTTDAYLDAFFDRLRKGSYRRSGTNAIDGMGVYVQTLGNLKAQGGQSQDSFGNQKRFVWHTVNERGQKEKVCEVNEDVLKALPEVDAFGDKHFPHGGYWPKCAVVGPSGLLLKYQMGQEIDSHDAVFRFDDAPTLGYEAHVGGKTTVRIVSDANHMKGRTYARSHTREMVLQHIDTQGTLEQYAAYKVENPRETFNLHALAPGYKLFLNRFVRIPIPHGFYGVMLAMQKCERVRVYGFTHGTPNKDFVQPSYYESSSGIGLRGRGSQRSYDEDEINMLLISELSKRLKVVEVSEPCQTLKELFAGECKNCSTTKLSLGAVCQRNIPFPVAKKGWCYVSNNKEKQKKQKKSGEDNTLIVEGIKDMASAYMKDMLWANCFAPCGSKNETCPGGFEAPPCTSQITCS